MHTSKPISLKKKIKKLGRDLHIDWPLMGNTLYQLWLAIALLVSTIVLLVQNTSEDWNLFSEVWTAFFGLFGIIGFSITGFIVDYVHNTQKLQFWANLICVCLTLIGFFIPPLSIVAICSLLLIGPLVVNFSLDLLISQTTPLNRGRYSMITIYLLALGIIPVLYILNLTGFPYILLAIINIGLLITIQIFERYYPLPESIFRLLPNSIQSLQYKSPEEEFPSPDLDIIKIEDMNSKYYTKIIKNWWESIKDSGLILLLVITFLLSITIGFHLSILNEFFLSMVNLAIFVGLIVLFVFISSLVIDYYGRKPVALIAVLMIGIYSLFFDFSNLKWYQPAWYYIFPIVISMAIMFILCIVADLSDTFRRGGIISTQLNFVLAGIMIGFFIETQAGIDKSNISQQEAIIIADFSTLASVLGLFLLNFTPEPFEKDSLHWRRYLDRLVIVTKNGTNIFFHQFNADLAKEEDNIKNNNDNEVSSDTDLISGGLTGIQLMLKEISKSDKQLEILDHQDLKFIFAHGRFSTSILITTGYASILRSKLFQFHDAFEKANEKKLEHFMGRVGNFNELPELMKKYFEVKKPKKKKKL